MTSRYVSCTHFPLCLRDLHTRTHSVIYYSTVCESKGLEPLKCPLTEGRLVQSGIIAPTDSNTVVKKKKREKARVLLMD